MMMHAYSSPSSAPEAVLDVVVDDEVQLLVREPVVHRQQGAYLCDDSRRDDAVFDLRSNAGFDNGIASGIMNGQQVCVGYITGRPRGRQPLVGGLL